MPHIIRKTETITYDVLNSDLPPNTPIYAEETYHNKTEGYVIGGQPMYETWATIADKKRLYQNMQRAYGRCISSLYTELGDRGDFKTGWVFERTMKYEDSDKTYVYRTWVSLYVKTDNGYASLVLA